MFIPDEQRAEIEIILRDRANEVASYYEANKNTAPDAVCIALRCEITRLRRLAEMIAPQPFETLLGSIDPSQP